MPALERQVASSIHLNFLTPVVMLMPKADNAASKSMIKMTKSLKKLADSPSYLPTDAPLYRVSLVPLTFN